MGRSCALSGHRKLGDDISENQIFDSLEELILHGYDYFLCGMAQGFDLLALECLIDLKQRYPIFIEACIPFVGQERRFSPTDQKKYRNFLSWCDKQTVLFEGYRNGCFLARDRYMVERADLILAYCTQETGGTAYTIRYAQQKKIPIVNLAETDQSGSIF